MANYSMITWIIRKNIGTINSSFYCAIAMFYITQSNDTQILLDRLIQIYQSQTADGRHTSLGAQVFAPFTVIVPSMVLGDWLTKAVASQIGISTLFTAQFWGQYQWQMIQKVLKIDVEHNAQIGRNDSLEVPEVAVLSASVMRWRLFGFLSAIDNNHLHEILDNHNHPLEFLLATLHDKKADTLPEHRIWQVCEELSAVYVRYLTHRPEWLHAWTHDAPLPMSVDAMMAQKQQFATVFGDDAETPEWLSLHYHKLEALLRYLWRSLFAQVYDYREALEHRFWQVLTGERGDAVYHLAKGVLPQALYLFTVQQIPLVELQFLKRLSTFIDVHLFHFNPSKMFWADIVDKNWLATQRIIRPNTVYLKDHGHSLLSRLGKESRETFAMLADMSGGEFYYEKPLQANPSADDTIRPHDWQVVWSDEFRQFSGQGLLNQLKKDILMLDESGVSDEWLGDVLDILQDKQRAKGIMTLDDTARLPSLSIHACHSLKRQLEIARIMIARYLNEPNADGSARHLSDVVVYLPDVAEAESLIRLVFDDGVGVDGLSLPAKITGTTNKTIDELMQAIAGFYTLLGGHGRFYCQDVYDWLMLPAMYQSFHLSFDEMSRACELLAQAGFRRGFDARHLAQTLDGDDVDYRYSFSYALDRLVLGLLNPDDDTKPNSLLYPFDWQAGAFGEATTPLSGISLSDQKIISVLCAIHDGLSAVYGQYQQVDLVQTWLDKIETDVIDRYFAHLKDTPQMRAIFEAKNSIAASLRANKNYHKHLKNHHEHILQSNDEIKLSLQFVLESISAMVANQAISAEPAGVITFARFGALRSIPFGLTVMLGMNLSAFPRQDTVQRLDLMRAGLRRRGDRMNEDDDNGAFLDAILCSRDACMIFYDSIASDGITELLPASPVSELLEFLKNGVDWQTSLANGITWMDATSDEIGSAIAKAMPSVVEQYLVTHHAATSFDTSLFYQADAKETTAHAEQLDHYVHDLLMTKMHAIKDAERARLVPAPLWQSIRTMLDRQSTQMAQQALATFPSDDEYQAIFDTLISHLSYQSDSQAKITKLISQYQLILPSIMTVSKLASRHSRFALNFLQNKISLDDENDEDTQDEPLSLDALTRYQTHDRIIQAMANGAFDGMSMRDWMAQILNKNLSISSNQLNQVASQTAGQNTQASTQANAQRQFRAIFYDDLLPAGVSRFDSLHERLVAIADIADTLFEHLSKHHILSTDDCQAIATADGMNYSKLIHPVHEVGVTLQLGEHKLSLMAHLPKDTPNCWLSILPKSVRAKHLLQAWLSHLAWQIECQTTKDDITAGRYHSIWQFSKSSGFTKDIGLGDDVDTLCFNPIEATTAKRLLECFVLIAQLSYHLVLPMTVDAGIKIAFHHGTDKLNLNEKIFYQYINSYQQEMEQAWQVLITNTDIESEIQRAYDLGKILYQILPSMLCTIDTLAVAKGDKS